jgi:hypothetical protein
LKEVNEEILKIAHSIKQETIDELLAVDEIATYSSRVIERDKNVLITLNAPLEITQKQPLAIIKCWVYSPSAKTLNSQSHFILLMSAQPR